jgi:hypothetical protein
VTYDVEFSNGGEIYTVFVRYREPVSNTPEFQGRIDGAPIAPTSTLYASNEVQFEWRHLPDMDFTPTSNVPLSFTFMAVGGEFEVDAFALVRGSLFNTGGGVTVDDSFITTYSIPEPASATFLLFGSILFLRRRRS